MYCRSELYNHLLVDKSPQQALCYDLYPNEGIRFATIESVVSVRNDDNAKLISALMVLVRLAIPRRGYSKILLNYIVGIFE